MSRHPEKESDPARWWAAEQKERERLRKQAAKTRTWDTRYLIAALVLMLVAVAAVVLSSLSVSEIRRALAPIVRGR